MRRPPALEPVPLVPRWLLAIVVVAVLLGVGAIGLRWYGGRRAARALIEPAKADTTTPQSLGIPYADLQIESGDHTIHAWWVRAASPDTTKGQAAAAAAAIAPLAAPAVLLFHGNGTSLPRQLGVQQVLYRAGISSLAFDYSGFGASGGTASPQALRRDARAAFGVFADSATGASRRILLGASLGAAVLLDDITDLEAGCDGVALVGTFTSARDLAIRSGPVPDRFAWLLPHVAWLLPDLYDNVAAIRHLTKPVLIVASVQDSIFPIAGAERLYAAASEPKRLVRLEHTGHDAYLATDESWQPVIAFIKQGPQ